MRRKRTRRKQRVYQNVTGGSAPVLSGRALTIGTRRRHPMVPNPNPPAAAAPAHGRGRHGGARETKLWIVQQDNLVSIEITLSGLSFTFGRSYKPIPRTSCCTIYSCNISGTVLVATYLNDHPRHRTTNNKRWFWLQEGRDQLKLNRYPQLPWLLNGMQFRKGWTSSPLISTPFIG
jgi:hypothetical protein